MKRITTAILLLCTILSCTKNEDSSDPVLQLPPETQTGANTFGCYINGKLLIPRNGTGTVGGSDDGAKFWGDATIGSNPEFNEIDVHDYKSERTANILIHIQNLHQVGVGSYKVDLSNGMSSIDGLDHTYLHCRVFDDKTQKYQYYRSFDNSGVVKITRYDIPNRIVSGTFSCRVRNSTNANDEIEITQGRFDFKWDILSDKYFP